MSASNQTQSVSSPPTWRTSRRRRWLFRGLALLLGLSPLLITEVSLRVAGWQPADAIVDPYVGFSTVRPLFELSEDGSHMQIAANRKPLFCDDSFLAQKPANGLRIFCVGGSTVQGRPFAVETSFTTWLEISLQLLLPDRKVEVINCGGVSYASYRLVPIVDELMSYQPDLVVVYTGHNEFLEDRTYESVAETPGWVRYLHDRLSALRTYTMLRGWIVTQTQPADEDPDLGSTSAQTPQAGIEILPTEVEARLDFQGGLELYQRDDEWKQQVIDHYELNLRRIVATTQAADVPLVLVNPVSNLKDCEPFKSQHGDDVSPETRERIAELIRQTRRSTPMSIPQLEQNLIALRQAVDLDERYATSHFLLGRAEFDWAKRNGVDDGSDFGLASFVRAKEEDVCPLRMLEPMHDRLRAVAKEKEVKLVDARKLFQSLSSDGIVGAESLVDHVHPSIGGHQKLADLLLTAIQDELDLHSEVDRVALASKMTQPEFLDHRVQRYQQHLESLPDLYFELGKDRLEGLYRWSHGKVRRMRHHGR